MKTTAEIKAMYGSKAVISRKGGFALVHLDSPTPAVKRKRVREFKAEDVFCADCPLCAVLRESKVVVFDDSIFQDEEVTA